MIETMERKSQSGPRAGSLIFGKKAPTFAFSLALALAATFATAALAASCSGRMETSIRNDLSARVAIRVEVPDALAARVRQIGGMAPGSPLFNAQKIRDEFEGRSTMNLVDLSVPNPESMTSVIWIPALPSLASDSSLVPPGLLSLKTVPAGGGKPAMKELSFSLDRQNAAKAFKLFPGLDSRLVESLSPPALETDPLSAADYRMNLETVIVGKKAMPAFDACFIEISVIAPKSILESGGGTALGQVFKAKIPLMDILTLERPVAFRLMWAD
ncbi:MAG TPA: hypothetical protein VIO60_11160 [Rectinemataceae bacterium]